MNSDTQTTVTSLLSLLNEEKWTRERINNYSLKSFKQMNSIMEQAKRSGNEEAIRNICEEHLHHTPHSIHAMYIVGKIELEQDHSECGQLQRLVDLFSKSKRYSIVEYLANEILLYGENVAALEALVTSYQFSNSNDKLISTYERLVKVKRDDAGLAYRLGTIKEQQQMQDEAVRYYKTAFLRFLKKGKKKRVEELWRKLIELTPDDLSNFLNLERRVKESLGCAVFASLLMLLVPHYREKGDLTTTIKLLKVVLANNPADNAARKALLNCYSELYEQHEQLQKFLGLSGLTDFETDIQTAVHNFEKHIRFDVGSHVYHRKWGVGTCRSIGEDTLTIDFKTKPNHPMNLHMAADCLEVIPENHIWFLKAREPEKLRLLILGDVEEGLRLILNSKGNAASVKDFKGELVGSVLKNNEWEGWWHKARKVLKSSPFIGERIDGEGYYFIRESPIDLDEDMYLQFMREKNFNNKCTLFLDFVKEGFAETDYIDEMLQYFYGFLLSPEKISTNSVISFILLQWLQSTQGYLPAVLPFDFAAIMEHVDNIAMFFPPIPTSDMKKRFLHNIRTTTEEWPALYVECLYLSPSVYILDELIARGKQELVEKAVDSIVLHYRENTELFIWLGKHVLGKKLESKINMDTDRIILNLIHLLEISNKELINQHDVAQNKRLFNALVKILFKDSMLLRYIKAANEREVLKIIPVVMNLSELGTWYKIQVKFAVKSFYPHIVFTEDKEKVEQGKNFFVTRESYEWKQEELRFLREGGVSCKEYEKELEENLKRAQILSPIDVNTNVVSVGTLVTLISNDRKQIQKYTILGPWDADPSEKIVSYTSSIGQQLINKSEGDEVDIEVHGDLKRFFIKKVEKAMY